MNNSEENKLSTDKYYDSIAKGYNELHAEEQFTKLETIGKEINSNPELKTYILESYKLLDVGCGTGISTGFFKCKNRTGIDPSKKLIEIAKIHYPSIEFLNGESENLPFRNNSFDVIISLTAIQNFKDVDKGLSEIKRVGKDKFILTFLKKSQKKEIINQCIKNKFKVIHIIEQDKDIIYFCK